MVKAFRLHAFRGNEIIGETALWADEIRAKAVAEIASLTGIPAERLRLQMHNAGGCIVPPEQGAKLVGGWKEPMPEPGGRGRDYEHGVWEV